jgi:pimeloyl-ACP methyl ester carboxylesterase
MKIPIINQSGESLDFDYRQAKAGQESAWVFVLGHGVTGDKDRPIVAEAAQALNAAGFDTLCFSFAGNGKSQGRFEEATITKEVGDLGAVLDTLSGRNIGYLGHSMGAAVGVLRAKADPRIRLLISLAGMVDTRRFAQTEFGTLTPGRDLMWDEASCPLDQFFMTDLCQTVKTVADSARTLEIPWLLIHGRKDDIVPIDESQSIAAMGNPNVRFVPFDAADHSFTGAARAPCLAALVQWAATVSPL